ncbi:MAG: 16S rRNA (adenine(1518)-N(6)/adenine(1519)-N(6))-dimethyltransferase RsmA [Firmicutes bacterium]|nr:ribosomal RNA small subunit methyltransferase A [Alicyclobacillaceae bacterium]MCL6497225.1 16S rRNA (adenine(1518)-N(6)/adenine(1519)-N(6))-dimethyltransferase RsmA [Bacillota bacterium]
MKAIVPPSEDPRTAAGLRHLLEEAGVRPERRWGQHFLIDRRVAAAIVDLVPPHADVIEIGPGAGALTVGLLERGQRVVAIELDRRLVALLTRWQARFGHFRVVEGDAQTLSWATVARTWGLNAPVAIVGNLPYYATAPLLAKLWEDGVSWSRAVLMVQKEVADRVVAEPGTRRAGSLSVMVRWAGTVRKVLTVPPSAFFPPPEVHSAVVAVDHQLRPPVALEALRWVVAAGFRYRRKMLRQALAQAGAAWGGTEFWSAWLEGQGIDPARRAESLTFAEWVRLAAALPAGPAAGRQT